MKAEGLRAPSPSAYLTKFQQVGSETLAKFIKNLNTNQSWVIGVAKSFNLLLAAFFTQSCAVGNIYYHLQQGLRRLPIAGPEVFVSGLPPLEAADMPSFLYRFGSFPDILDMLVNQFVEIDKVDWVFCNTFYKLEEEVTTLTSDF